MNKKKVIKALNITLRAMNHNLNLKKYLNKYL